MQHNRSRGGNSFQERDSEGRFTSSSRRGRQNDRNNDSYNDRGYNNRGGYGREKDQYANQHGQSGEYFGGDGYEDRSWGREGDNQDQGDYRDDYGRGRNGYRNENEDYRDNNYGGSYRESYGGRNDHNENDYSNQGGGWEDDRSGYEREGYGRNRNYDRNESDGRTGRWGRDMNWAGNGRNRNQDQGGRGYTSMNRDQVRELGRRGSMSDGRSHHGDTSHRGFASMPSSEVRRIASMGGKASHNRRGRTRVSARRRDNGKR